MDRTDQPDQHDDQHGHADRSGQPRGPGRADEPRPADPKPNIRLTGTDQSEHDALAELFLGDAPFAPQPMDKRPSREDDDQDPRPGRGPDAGAPAQPPAPVRETDRPRYEGSAVRAERPAPAAPTHPSDDQPARERPTLELVVLGHLPVRASLWVRQYACLSARKRSETVALVRAAAGTVSVDVITGRQAAEIDPVDSVEDAVTIATAAASRIVLRVDEIAEPEVLERDGIDEVTILTGADEAAVVASYRLIKTFAAQLDRLDPDTAPTLRVAVMGNPGADIQDARARIAKACNSFLDRPIEILDASGRLDATGTVTVCRTDRADATAETLDALLGPAAQTDRGAARSTATPAAAPPPPPATLRFPGTAEQAPEIVIMPRAGRAGQAQRHATPEPRPTPPRPDEQRPPQQNEPARRPEPGAAAPDEPRSLSAAPQSLIQAEPQAQPQPQPSRRPEPAARPAVALPDRVAEPKPPRLRGPLATLVEGLTPLETRCPTAPGVELACDEEGRLHAVATDDRGAGDAVAALLTAAAWARANLALLIRAESGVAMPSPDPRDDADAVLHLLARRPSAARAVLDTDVRVYALATVDTDDCCLHIATPLNDD